MNDKVLVILYVPIIGEKYNCFIPLNKKVQNVINLFMKILYDLNDQNFDMTHNHSLYIKETGKEVNKNVRIRETSIRNATELILM